MPRQTLKQRPDGRYRCKYKGMEFYGSTQGEALAAREAYKRAEERGIKREAAGTTAISYVLRWLPAYRAGTNRAAYNQYAGILDGFCSFVGPDTLLQQITKTDIVEYYNSLSGKSHSYISKAKSLVRSMLADAVDDGIIPINPARAVKPPQGASGTHRALEPWERQLVHEMIDHRFGICAMLMLYGGLRRGEVLAFDIDRDVDFENKRIYVREAVSFSEGIRGTKKAPKTAAGVRSLPLFEPLRNALEGKHGGALKAKNGANTLSAFDRAWESYISQMESLLNGCPKRWYGKTKEHKALLASGEKLPPWRSVTIRTHDFRHSFCTMCCDAHVPIEVLMQWMGHSDDKMIRRIYDHVTDARKLEAEQKTAAEIDRFLCSRGQNGGQAKNESNKIIEI